MWSDEHLHGITPIIQYVIEMEWITEMVDAWNNFNNSINASGLQFLCFRIIYLRSPPKILDQRGLLNPYDAGG